MSSKYNFRSSDQSPILKSALALFTKLYTHLKNAEAGVEDDTYDGDEDGEMQQEASKRKKKKTVGLKKKLSHCIKLQGDKNGIKADKLQYIVRDVIFYIGE